MATGRGATRLGKVTVGGTRYTVTFDNDVSKCSFTASPVGTAAADGARRRRRPAATAVVVNVARPAPTRSTFR